MQEYFNKFRANILGLEQNIQTPSGVRRINYLDWTASGRLYKPIEENMINNFGCYVANTHTETTATGTTMTYAYHKAQSIIKKSVNASKDDVIILTGTGMTGALSKLQRILGLRVPEKILPFVDLKEYDKPVVFVTHMEHHSNQTSWMESIAEVIVIPPDRNGLVDIQFLEEKIKQFSNRKIKIGAFTGCSNVTGIQTPINRLAEIMHENNGYCFADYAASGPYIKIDMHPENPAERLDAVFFSPHKFLGGPGTSGVLIFNKNLYNNRVPDQPGGGTVNWTNPWGEHSFIEDIEAREDGGTPGFLQGIRTALAIILKEEMGVKNIEKRENEMNKIIFEELRKIPKLHILADNIEHRLSIFSFYFEHIHYNLVVKLLNDYFGIQTRGGCSCAGTYGHYLLNVTKDHSHSIACKIDSGNLEDKPGWVRASFHPTTTNDEIYQFIDALNYIYNNIVTMSEHYYYDSYKNEFIHKTYQCVIPAMVDSWFC